MSQTPFTPRGLLSIIACASRPAQRVPDLVQTAQTVGWDVGVILTPQATKFVDVPLLEQLTGYPVEANTNVQKSHTLPRADAIVVFPATFNTLNKWALGISDTLALGLLCEYLGQKMPIVAIPCVLTNSGLDTHPAFPRSIAQLRAYRVHILYEPEKYPPKNEVPWRVILEELHRVLKKE